MSKPPCAWINEKKICGKIACDKEGPCEGFEVSKTALAGEAIRKRRQQLRERRVMEHHLRETAKILALLPRHQTRDDAIHALAMHLLLPRDDKVCATECQYAKDVAMPEYNCATECQYELRASADRARKIIEFVENAMADFRWKPPTNTVGRD